MFDTDKHEKVAWSTEKINNLMIAIDEGYKPKTNPFYEGNPTLRKGNIIFEYTEKELAEIKKCSQDIIYFANTYCTVMTDKGLDRIILRDYQEKMIRQLADKEKRFNIVLAARQTGKTIVSSIYIAWYVLFNFDRNVLVLANKGDTTKEILDKSKTILDNLEFFMKPGVLKNDVFNQKYDNGCRIVGQSTTKKAGIGFTIHLLFLDEFAHIHPNFLDSFYENVFPTISSSKISRVIITSTPGGFNKFYEIYEGAVKRTNEFNAFRIDWWQVPGRDKEWMRKEIENLGSIQAFNRQYGNQFMSSGNLLMNPEHIKKLDENLVIFVSHAFSELEDTEIEYSRSLTWHPKFDIDEISDRNKFWVFSVDVAEGGRADHSVINIFKLRLLDKTEFKDVSNPGTFSDFYGLDQVGIFRSNEHNIDQFSKILYVLTHNLFYSENVKIVLEWNTYGGELLKCLSTVFPQNNDFGEEMIVKFKHRNDARSLKPGLRIKSDNKPILCQKFKKVFNENRIMFYDPDTVEEAKSFGKMPSGVYKATRGHDDCVMTAINASEFLDTADYIDFVEEMYDNVDEETNSIIENEIEASKKGDGTLNYDVYDILWSEEEKRNLLLEHDSKNLPEDTIFDFI